MKFLYVTTFSSSTGIVEKSLAYLMVQQRWRKRVTIQPNISLQINTPTSNSADFDVMAVVVPHAPS